MEKLVILILVLILLLISGLAFGQKIIYNADGTVDLKFATKQEWETFRDDYVKMDKDLNSYRYLYDTVYMKYKRETELTIIMQDSIINMLKRQVVRDSAQTEYFKGKAEPQKKKWIEFDGLFAGLSTSYAFSDSVSQFVSTLQRNMGLILKPVIKINDDLFLSPFIEIPFRKESSSFKFEIAYKPF